MRKAFSGAFESAQAFVKRTFNSLWKSKKDERLHKAEELIKLLEKNLACVEEENQALRSQAEARGRVLRDALALLTAYTMVMMAQKRKKEAQLKTAAARQAQVLMTSNKYIQELETTSKLKNKHLDAQQLELYCLRRKLITMEGRVTSLEDDKMDLLIKARKAAQIAQVKAARKADLVAQDAMDLGFKTGFAAFEERRAAILKIYDSARDYDPTDDEDGPVRTWFSRISAYQALVDDLASNSAFQPPVIDTQALGDGVVHIQTHEGVQKVTEKVEQDAVPADASPMPWAAFLSMVTSSAGTISPRHHL